MKTERDTETERRATAQRLLNACRYSKDQRLGSWDIHARMARLVTAMSEYLEEEGVFDQNDMVEIDDKVLIPFLAACPAKVREEVREG